MKLNIFFLISIFHSFSMSRFISYVQKFNANLQKCLVCVNTCWLCFCTTHGKQFNELIITSPFTRFCQFIKLKLPHRHNSLSYENLIVNSSIYQTYAMFNSVTLSTLNDTRHRHHTVFSAQTGKHQSTQKNKKKHTQKKIVSWQKRHDKWLFMQILNLLRQKITTHAMLAMYVNV